MKFIFTLQILLLTAVLSFAQSANKGKHNEMIARLLRQHAESGSTMKTSSTAGERVLAQSTHDSLGTLSDSVNLSYSQYHGSTFDYNTMIYPYNYPYSATPMFSFKGIFTTPQVLFDTMQHFTADPFTLIYGPYEAGYATYDAAKNPLTYKDIFVDSAHNQNMSYANAFTINNITSGYWFDLHLGVPDSAFKQFFSYNSSGQLTEDSLYEYHAAAWHLVARSLYTYSTSGNLTQIDGYANTTDTTFTMPLIEQIQYINTYDAANRLNTVLTNQYTGTALSAYVKDTFAYTGTHTFHTSWKEYQYDPINAYWAPLLYMTKVLNTAGRPDTVNIQGWDSLANAWTPQTMDVVHYNTMNDPDTLYDYEYNFTNFPVTPSYTTVYYYGPYLNNTAVNNTPVTADNTKIFPNPATNTITILQPDLLQNTPITISLINVAGQILLRTTLNWQNKAELNISNLQPGIYYVLLQGNDGIIHKQSVVKE